jgi:hypothetical protein
MKPLLLGAAALALAAAVNLSPAMALGPKPSGGNTWPRMSRPVMPALSAAVGSPAHYEFRYGYDKRAAWRGHWVLAR